MLGLFGTLNLGARALQAQQTGVEVAGQNLANVNNPAYARQRVYLQTSPTVDSPLGRQGTGVEVAAIEQIRNAFLDGQIRDETSVGSYWESQQGWLESGQAALNEFLDQSATSIDAAAEAGSATTAQGLSAELTQLFNTFQGVASAPTSLSQRQALVSQAESLTSNLNQVSKRLSSVATSLDESIVRDTDSVNQALSDIADLNKQITIAEATGGTANELRDLRQQKLEGLAKLANFQVTTAADGTLTLSAGSQVFVTGSVVRSQLVTLQVQGRLVVASSADNAWTNFTGGSIKAAMDIRAGALGDLQSGLDLLASQLITQVNAVYSGGYDLDGGTGASFFTGSNASNIGVNSTLRDNPSKVQAAGMAGAVGNNEVALALARLAEQPIAGLQNHTFSEAYGQLVVSFGNDLSNVNTQVANHTAVSKLLLGRRDSVSGVSMEEEMASLMSYQKAYQASARIITTVDQMLEEVINLKR
jgi:flagellar hook-associated protein 1